MIDAWEVFGRMFTNATFRGAIYQAAAATPAVTQNTRAQFKQADYTTMLAAVRTVITGRPISLMGLGEILWPLAASNSATFQQHVNAIATLLTQINQQSGIAITSGDYNFYVALAAMTVDENLRNDLLTIPTGGGADPFDTFGYATLSANDRSALRSLFTWTSPAAAAGAAPDLQLAANTLCLDGWTDDCFILTEFKDYGANAATASGQPHSHPLPWVGGSFQPAPLSGAAAGSGS